MNFDFCLWQVYWQINVDLLRNSVLSVSYFFTKVFRKYKQKEIESLLVKLIS